MIIPGGESTTIGKLAASYGLVEPLREFARAKPTWGTCAGMIFLAKDIGIDEQPILGAMDIRVDRNAFGRQIDSFETELDIAGLAGGRLPRRIHSRAGRHGGGRWGGSAGACLRTGASWPCDKRHLLATAFHPELTGDLRLHSLFCAIVRETVA